MQVRCINAKLSDIVITLQMSRFYLCAYVCVCVCVCLYFCAHASRGQRTTLGVKVPQNAICLVFCGGLNEISLYRLIDLNPWSPGNGTI